MKFSALMKAMSDHPLYILITAFGVCVTLAGIGPLLTGKPLKAVISPGVVEQCKSLAGEPAKIRGTEDELPAIAADRSDEAIRFCALAATAKGQDLAFRFDLARAYEANGQPGAAISEYHAAATAGYVPAMDVFGRRLNSLGDESGAIKWLQCAAASGSRQAAYDLSLIFLARSRGDDLSKARWLASRSSQAGFQPASKLMATVESLPGSERAVADDWLAAAACPPQGLSGHVASSAE